jgi:cell division protein FtsW
LNPPTQPRRRALALAGSTVDYPLIAVVATLLALGLVMVYSASFTQRGAHFFTQQILWIGIGTVGLILMAAIPYRFWQRVAIPIMVITLILLVAVLLFGTNMWGARRTLFGGRIQPSELAKLSVVIYSASWVASKRRQLGELRGGLVPFSILIGLVAGLIVLERSFSVTIIILVTGITIFFVGGGDIKQLLIMGGITAGVLVLLVMQSGYGAKRVQDWWLAVSDPTQAPYSVSQAMNILRRGAGIGTNPSNWLQKESVPLLWSDYIFANVGADLSLPGTLSVLALFAAFGYRGLSIALRAADRFGGLSAIGITTWILAQAVIHIGASLALIPATGIPLPFMSYGGSAMLSCMLGIGLLLSISRAAPEKKSANAHFAFGGRDWRSRLPNPGGGQRAESEPATTAARRRRGSAKGRRPPSDGP